MQSKHGSIECLDRSPFLAPRNSFPRPCGETRLRCALQGQATPCVPYRCQCSREFSRLRRRRLHPKPYQVRQPMCWFVPACVQLPERHPHPPPGHQIQRCTCAPSIQVAQVEGLVVWPRPGDAAHQDVPVRLVPSQRPRSCLTCGEESVVLVPSCVLLRLLRHSGG